MIGTTFSARQALALVLMLAPAWAAPAFAKEYTRIGEVDFKVDCSEAVRDDFDHALGLMHHMMYQQARGRFEAIAEREPACAMAYWGIATTLFQPLWATRPSGEQLQRGWALSNKARKRADSRREKLLIDATAAFFREPESAEFPTRIERWVEAMEAPYEAFPEDADIAALHALSRLARAQRVRNRAPLFDEAEAILRKVHKAHPAHPGAIHYMIHATDVDGRAKHALGMVAAYSEIAPEVPHALHMPSHIYVRLGDWPKVIAWNRRSADAALEHPVNGAVSLHYLHAADYLAYAYLQRGEWEKAEAVVEDALAKRPYQSNFITAYHAASLPARLAVERRDWERAAELTPRKPENLPWDRSPWAEGQTWYARGLGALHTDDMSAAREAGQRLETLREKAKAQGDHDIATYIEIDRRVLAGRIAQAQGDSEKALELTRSAAELERTVEKHPVTPGALLPPYEALGNLLMELDRPDEALDAYEKSEAVWPGRFHTAKGAERAAEAAGSM